MVIVKNNRELFIRQDNFTGKIINCNNCRFLKNAKSHRYYGPAATYLDGSKYWWFNGLFYRKVYSQKDFIKKITSKFLFNL